MTTHSELWTPINASAHCCPFPTSYRWSCQPRWNVSTPMWCLCQCILGDVSRQKKTPRLLWLLWFSVDIRIISITGLIFKVLNTFNSMQFLSKDHPAAAEEATVDADFLHQSAKALARFTASNQLWLVLGHHRVELLSQHLFLHLSWLGHATVPFINFHKRTSFH